MRLENKAGGSSVEAAHWDQLREMRAIFVRLLKGGSILGAPVTTDEGPVIPLLKPIKAREEYSWGNIKAAYRVPLVTVTSKMSCGSFSLVSGPLFAHGTCPASNYSVMDVASRVRALDAAGHDVDAATVTRVGKRLKRDFDGKLPWNIKANEIPGMYICDSCYAGKGRYGYLGIVQFQQMARYLWVQRSLADGSFVPTMVRSIRDFLANDQLLMAKFAASRYFRIHDSGDMGSPEYLKGWLDICREVSEVQFWCPTRVWAVPQMQEVIQAVGVPTNLALRPSQFVFGARAPIVRVPGIAAGSTSSPWPMAAMGHWDCPAYMSPSGSCAEIGCRVCWDNPEIPVNYLTH